MTPAPQQSTATVDTLAPTLGAAALHVQLDGATILPELTLEVAPGKFTAIIGPNGCGKSTLLRTLIRLIKPHAGHVELDGTDIAHAHSKALARRMALLPQSAHAPGGITVRDLVARGRFPHTGLLRQWTEADDVAVAGALEATGLQEWADRHVDGLSGGQRQRVWVAMLLAQQTRVVLLDEPTTYLDIAHQYTLLELINEMAAGQGRTVVAVLHDLQQAAHYADELVVMKAGQIVAQGAPADILSAELIKDVFGLDCHLVVDDATGTVLVVPDRPGRPDLSAIPPLG